MKYAFYPFSLVGIKRRPSPKWICLIKLSGHFAIIVLFDFKRRQKMLQINSEPSQIFTQKYVSKAKVQLNISKWKVDFVPKLMVDFAVNDKIPFSDSQGQKFQCLGLENLQHRSKLRLAKSYLREKSCSVSIYCVFQSCSNRVFHSMWLSTRNKGSRVFLTAQHVNTKLIHVRLYEITQIVFANSWFC